VRDFIKQIKIYLQSKQTQIMKKIFAILFIASLCVACGGGSGSMKLTNNKYLGKFPSVYVEWAKAQKQLMEDMRSKTGGNIEKIGQKEADLATNAIATATKELEKIQDKLVPFEFNYEDPDFEVVSAKIETADVKTGALAIALTITAKHEIKASIDKKIKFLIINNENQAIYSGTINPFVSNQVILRNPFTEETIIAQGEVCCWQGSMLMLYCGSYDFTGFSKILFVQ